MRILTETPTKTPTNAHTIDEPAICLAERLRERSKQVEGMVKSQEDRLNRVRDMLEKKAKKSSSASSGARTASSNPSTSTGTSTSANTAEKVVVSCAECSQKVRVPAGVTGTISCPACGKKFRTDGKGGSERLPSDNKAEAPKAGSANADSSKESKAAGEDEKVVVECPMCAQKLRIKSGQAGTIKCPSCSAPFAVSFCFSSPNVLPCPVRSG
jgi:Zn finger protein HypA/HybF involved in hydrogenase expression